MDSFSQFVLESLENKHLPKKENMLRHIKMKTKMDSDTGLSKMDILSHVMSSSSFISFPEADSSEETLAQIQTDIVPRSSSLTDYSNETGSTCSESDSLYNGNKRKVSFDMMPSLAASMDDFSDENDYPTHKKTKTESNLDSSRGRILYQLEDSNFLNPLHCLVRRNVEFFVATDEDISAPCPGRKEAIRKGQVGLRCIHCRDASSKERVKRAVCYPSSVSRVYRCVSDMKFDHFPSCLPPEEKFMFYQLKGSTTSHAKGENASPVLGGGSTSKYYYDSALSLGLRDSTDGRFVVLSEHRRLDVTTISNHDIPISNPVLHCDWKKVKSIDTSKQIEPTNVTIPKLPSKFYNRLLAEPEDAQYLNAVHCFVRQNVEVFAADEHDISLPAPGRKSQITIGQIGIRCIHCKHLKFKDRVKRAMCYPPSVSGIYHSISNMKFDHFGACRGLTPMKRQEFASLKTESYSKGSKSGRPHAQGSSTARYYTESALNLGLVDTPLGIRYIADIKR